MGKNYKINDDLTLEMDGKVYRLTKNNSENCSHCPLHNIEDCVELCGDTYFEAAERPAFEHRESIFVEVAENKETTMEEKEHKNEPDYKALYEEEHKKYEDAVEKLKVLHSDWNSTQNRAAREIEHIFPELAESEEEKLSKKLHECVCRAINNDKLPYEERKYISEQVIPYLENLEKRKEQKATWSEEDEQNLNASLGYINDEYLRRWLKDIIHVKYDKPTWSEDDEETLNSAISFVEHSAFTSIGKGRNYVISWLKSLKDRVIPQTKQEWSEENEKMLISTIRRNQQSDRIIK